VIWVRRALIYYAIFSVVFNIAVILIGAWLAATGHGSTLSHLIP
jgi:hypothetical protein